MPSCSLPSFVDTVAWYPCARADMPPPLLLDRARGLGAALASGVLSVPSKSAYQHRA